ncbi:MAG: hypothetical protein ACTIK4_11520 [Mesonia sp.]|uniref:hypothetical protein n=1 Tax=Mesonia sp. TaxID=1960830 RepID=UPI003F943546
MKNRILLILFGVLFIIPNINAQNNLEPVESIFDEYDFRFEYYAFVRKMLMSGMSDTPELRFLIIPSFEVEEVVAIEERNEKYFIVHHKMKESIWYTEKNREKIEVEKKEIEISKIDLELYHELFKIVVKNRQYPDEQTLGFDGTNYYFSVADERLKTGTIWSPSEKSKIGRLTKIGNSLINLVQTTKKENIAKLKPELIKEIKELTTEMKQQK